jgi:hypothetical protein
MGTLAKTAIVVTIYRLPTKENKLLVQFAANKWKFVVSIFRLQQTNGICRFPYIYTRIYSIY